MNSEVTFPGKLGLQQRVLPSYRVPFFDMLASACNGGMSLFAGQPRAEESILSGKLQIANYAQAGTFTCSKVRFIFATSVDCWTG